MTSGNSNQFNDEKEHYKTLISIFKWSITIIGGVITIIGVIVGFFTYNNGKDMRESMEAEKKALRDQVDKLQEQLARKEENMDRKVNDLSNSTKEDVRFARDLAVNQIGDIRNVATEEARNRVDQVFDDNNFDQFVTKVAQQRMEPKIQKMVDEKMKFLENIAKEKVNGAINDFLSDDNHKKNLGYSYLIVNLDQPFTEDQAQKIIQVMRQNNFDEKNDRLKFYSILGYRNVTKVCTDFFINELCNKERDFAIKDPILTYLMRPELPQDLNLYERFLTITPSVNDGFNLMILIAKDQNEALTIQLLNNKTIIDSLFKELTEESQIKAYQENIRTLTASSVDDVEKTYFFRKLK